VNETLKPGHQRSIIICANVVPVFHHKQAFSGLCNVFNGRQAAVREDIFIDPGIDIQIGFIRSDGVQQEKTVRFDVAFYHVEIGLVIFRPDVFKHADGNNAIELIVEIAVILQQDGDIKTFAALLGHFLLFRRNSHAENTDAVISGCIFRQTSPTTANIKQSLPRLKLQFLTDHFQFGFLCLFKRGRIFPVGTGVLHIRVKHFTEQIVTQVVMLFTYDPGAFSGLQVGQPCCCDTQCIFKMMREFVLEPCGNDAMEEHV
jgi:hypothetical protein